MIDWCSASRFSHAITLNANRDGLSLASIKKMFGHFCLEVDRLRTGKHRVSQLHTSDRFEAIAFPEHLESNLHLHVAANFDRRYWGGRSLSEHDKFELSRIWSRITKGSGSIEVVEMKTADDRRRWGRYITKDVRACDHPYFLAADFHPSDRVVECPLLRKALDQLAA